jgi:hypothetical protein
MQPISQQHDKQQTTSNDVTSEGGNPFINAYRRIIHPIVDLINAQWSECTRVKTNLNIEEHASTDEV